jgi:peptide/nickel transport system permease protein
MSDRQLQRVRGSQIAMIFQDPMVALSPVHTIGQQLTRSLRNHRDLSSAERKAKAVQLLELVGVADAATRLGDYPHQFSGGMAQRVVIAMALACEPAVLIADEPTTALDVTVQQQVLDLIAELKELLGMAVLLITHDLGVVADSCDRAIVMYAGQVVEQGSVDAIFARPRHPYTSALLRAMPVSAERGRLPTIEGGVPVPWDWPPGCRFHPRCPYAEPRCTEGPIAVTDHVRCVRHHELDLSVVVPKGTS